MFEKKELPANYIDRAEEIMASGEFKDLTSSKIRNLLSMVNEIYNDEINNKGNARLTSGSVANLARMRVRLVYEAGRDDTVKKFVEKCKLLEYIKGVGDDLNKFFAFSQYMEALVAYHRYFAEKE